MRQDDVLGRTLSAGSHRHPNHLWRRLTEYVYRGVGAITIGLTENGNVGVWFGDDEKCSGSGDKVRDALMEAAATVPDIREGATEKETNPFVTWRVLDDRDICAAVCATEEEAQRKVRSLETIAPNAIGGRPITYRVCCYVEVSA